MGGVLTTLSTINALTQERRIALLAQRQPNAREFLGPRGALEYFENARGERIASYWWPARGAPRGVVLLVHGQGAYLTYEFGAAPRRSAPKRYQGSWIQALNDAGFSVAGVDNAGTGRSGGLFGYVGRFQDFVDDLLQLADLAAGRGSGSGAKRRGAAANGYRSAAPVPGFEPGLPLFGLGCSLGGCIALTASLQRPGLFAGLVLLAPMLSLERVKRQGANPILAPISHVLSAVVPTLPLVKTPKNTRFPELQEDWDHDPATYHYPARVRIGCELMNACDWLRPRMAAVATPLLVFHSEGDTMTDPDGSKALVAAAKAGDKTLRLVNGFWHILTKEEGNGALLEEAVAWIAARADGGGGGGGVDGEGDGINGGSRRRRSARPATRARS